MHDVPAGRISINVSYAGTPIYEEDDDLCTKAACPIKTGPIEITYLQELPPIAPPVRACIRGCLPPLHHHTPAASATVTVLTAATTMPYATNAGAI